MCGKRTLQGIFEKGKIELSAIKIKFVDSLADTLTHKRKKTGGKQNMLWEFTEMNTRKTKQQPT